MGDDDLKITRSRLNDQVASLLRDKILAGQLAPGQRVRQVEWAEELGVSRMPVRDAFNQLIAEGILHQISSGVVVVAKVDTEDLRDSYYLNAVITSLAARRAARYMDDSDLEELLAVHQSMEEAMQSNDRAAAAELNWTFHRLINLGSKSPRLLALLRTVANSIPHSAFQAIEQWPTVALTEHAELLDALRIHDGDAAADLMLKHVIDGSRHMITQLDKSSSGVTVAV